MRAADQTAQAGSIRSQMVAAPTAAKRGKLEDIGGKGDLQAASPNQAGLLDHHPGKSSVPRMGSKKLTFKGLEYEDGRGGGESHL
jgi:hypothetical protein